MARVRRPGACVRDHFDRLARSAAKLDARAAAIRRRWSGVPVAEKRAEQLSAQAARLWLRVGAVA
jgi:hypothetical protein